MSYRAETHSFITPSKNRPVVLVIGGSDSAGLAGVQMDVRCLHALGVHAATAITAVTAQNNQNFISLNPVSVQVLDEQIDAALALQPQAVKIGLLASIEQLDYLVTKLATINVPIIIDPIIRTSSDALVLPKEFLERIKKDLLPLCSIVTPNLPEAEQICGFAINNQQTMTSAGRYLNSLGVTWAVIKGGHSDGLQNLANPSIDNATDQKVATDVCFGDQQPFALSHKKLTTKNLRGTGCAFASFIAAGLALGYEARDSLVIAKMALQAGLDHSAGVGNQIGNLVPQGFPIGYWPDYFDTTLHYQQLSDDPFPSCVGGDEPDKLGLYPVVDSVRWLERLLPLGITTAQLRVKDLSGRALELEIEQAVALGKKYQCRLFINDYWQIAIAKGAYGVHLGQEDLLTADFNAIKQAGLRLGLSSHSHFEVARARAFRPSYIACGPTFSTTTKDMPWVPHGVEGLSYWVEAIDDFPLVSIGGIVQENIAKVAATGVSGVALITAITRAEDPEGAACYFKKVVEK